MQLTRALVEGCILAKVQPCFDLTRTFYAGLGLEEQNHERQENCHRACNVFLAFAGRRLLGGIYLPAMTPLPIDLHPGQPEMPDDTQLLLSLYTLNSAFDRIATVLSLLNSANTLSPESTLAKTVSLEALRTAITAEVREALGESTLNDLEQFSQNLRRMEHQLIEECMAPRYSVDRTRTDA